MYKYPNLIDLNNIDAQYWLGFIAADGCVSKDYARIDIGYLSIIDIDHLYKFKEFVKCKNNVIVSRNMCKICLSDIDTTNKIIEFGITPRKSHNLKINSEILINSKHFWRGVIDGDGCLSINNKNDGYSYPRMTLVGTYDLLCQFKDFVYNNINYTCKVYNHDKIYQIELHNNQARDMTEILYSNAKTYLDRKMEIAKSFIFE